MPAAAASQRCAIRGSCGSKGPFGPQLPCPDDGPPEEPDTSLRELLELTCGSDFASGPVCCTSDQVRALQSNFQQADPIISSCPACRNNFRSFYCSFTCSPNQSDFVKVTATQETSTGQTAVKALDFHVSPTSGSDFFDSCKNVKFGATNGYAMDFIGGGATNYSTFLQYMGDERPGLGSPFQINYPPPADTSLSLRMRSCSDGDLSSRCACVDCPSVCAVLPELPPPATQCHIGMMSCFSFSLLILYALCVVSFFTGYGISTWERKRKKPAFSLDSNSVTSVPTDGRPVLVGASSLASGDGDDSSGGIRGARLDRVHSLMDPQDFSTRQYRLNTVIRRASYKLGHLCASHPWVTLAIASAWVGALNSGWTKFAVETDPVRLWVPPDSEMKLQKEYFDEHFGPFYRTEQIFLTSVEPGESVLTWDRLKWWMDAEKGIWSLRSEPNGYGLHDVCFKPAGPRGPCVVQSIGAWFGNDLDDYDADSWQAQILSCASNPTLCLPDYGQPLGPQYILGGIPNTTSTRRWLSAEAMVITIVVSDSLDPVIRAKAEEWERALRAHLSRISEVSSGDAGVHTSYSTGVSLEEEINQSTNTDYMTVVLSYLAMFLYISATLGRGSRRSSDGKSMRKWARDLWKRFRTGYNPASPPRFPWTQIFVQSKVLLGLFGIILVLVSISTSVGLFSMLGVKVTLIIAEVIPFLVLAVGVDNVFILVHEVDRQNSLHGPAPPSTDAQDPIIGNTIMSPASRRSNMQSSHDSVGADSTARVPLSAEERVARAVGKMGPSILLSTVTETTAFALGALVPMPAVRNFALYAAGSVFIGAVLQATAFVAVMTLDLKREEDNRADLFPCFRVPQPITLPDDVQRPTDSVLARAMRAYARFLLQPSVKSVVIAMFAGFLVASVISLQHVQLGLDQRLALPADSYLVPYFNAVDKYLEIGPPVYFVSTDNDVTTTAGQKHLCGRFTTCDDFSLINTLEGERRRPGASFIAEPTAGWLDDFLQWLDPRIDTCCRVRKSDPSVFCSSRTPERLCRPCFEGRDPQWNITLSGMPEGAEFMRYLRQWLISPTDEDCPLGGLASYGSAVSLSDNGVEASHFRTFHEPLKTQSDFIAALAAARRIASDISKATGTSVFPYSLFYVFFEQYLYIVSITQEILGLGLLSVLLVTALLLGSWRTGIIVTVVVKLTVLNVMGIMGVWGISLNALSLVNLVISLGIAVEFCSHIARAFMNAGPGLPPEDPSSQKDRDHRVWVALTEVGPSVLSGITFTKLIGMSVLALTRSKLLEIYYFRMWLTLIIAGALNGLVLLPVVLSLVGGAGFSEADLDEEWMTQEIRRHDQEYAPFQIESDNEDSD